MKRILGTLSLSLALLACDTPNPALAPTPTTAILFNANFTGGAELRTIDLRSRAQVQILAAPALGSDSVVRVYDEMLYIIARDYMGQNNSLTVLDPHNGYKLACDQCQWALGEGTNVQDFWAVTATKAYFTAQPAIKDSASWQHRSDVGIIDPTTGVISKYIDIPAALAAFGDALAADDPDDYRELGALYADNAHLFVAITALNQANFMPAEKASEACGLVPGRVAVIDLDSDEVVGIIKLSGANPAPSPARFVREANSNYVLIGTPGSIGVAKIEDCGGIERIDQETLSLSAPYMTETQLGGSVMSFDVDAEGNGAAFIFTAGDYTKPTYEVRRFKQGAAPYSPALSAPGERGFTQSSFVRIDDRGQAFVGLPLRGGPIVQTFTLSTGEHAGDPFKLDLPPIDVAFYPGIPYRR